MTNRRQLLQAVVGGAALLAAAGCAPILTNPAVAPDDAFTPAGVAARMASARTLEDLEKIYGSQTRSLSETSLAADEQKKPRQGTQTEKDLPGEKTNPGSVAIWEWLAVRPSFHARKSIRSFCTPTVKKELHVRLDADRKILAWRLTGMFYVQFRFPAFSARITELRTLDEAELAETRVPVAAEEDYREVNDYYARLGWQPPRASSAADSKPQASSESLLTVPEASRDWVRIQ